MAVDEAILEATEQHGQCTLRFYQWSEPTLSLGYFQAFADRETHADSRVCPLVRRSTGGGAILHDVELTYSFACPMAKGDSSKATQLYDVFHKSLLQVLATEFGVSASLYQVSARSSEAAPFLCFQRRSKGDIVIGSHKVVGSAQRRRRRAVLQHGSVLLGVSSKATELPGIKELAQVTLCPEDLVESWSTAIRHEFEFLWCNTELNQSELEAAQKLERLRFASPKWTGKR